MSDDLLVDTAQQVFGGAEATARPGGDDAAWSAPLWDAVETAGFPLALTYAGEEDGFASQEALAIVRVAASHAAPVPVGETMIANWLFANAGIDVVDGPLTFGPVLRGERLTAERVEGGVRVSGRMTRVPYARHAAAIAVLVEIDGEALVARVPAAACSIEAGVNIAREPRDAVIVDTVVEDTHVAPSPASRDEVFALGALIRCLGMAGALETVLERTVAYAGERVQFGRPIGKFQAIQHNLAIMAGEVAAAGAAASMAAETLVGDDAMLLIASAKQRTGEAASKAAGLAHQIHGAIGFTQEFPLHLYTQRLWAWRDEFGAETEWAERLGAAALAAGGGEGYWPMITALDNRTGA